MDFLSGGSRGKEEKKVEFLELIYDLIFVYIIGRNNSLLENIEDGFVSPSVFGAYLLCGLAVIQIWCFSTFYTNLYGRNGVRDHVFMFVNMFLLYYIGQGTRAHWESFQTQYHVAWALILFNILLQYAMEYRAQRDNPQAKRVIRGMIISLAGQAVLVLLAIPLFRYTGVQMAGFAILFGVTATWFLVGRVRGGQVDFPHLTERAMLYVVFTFGEMIIAIAAYFDGEFSFSSVYFSAMSFLIVVGLFLCYELLYNRIIDRERETNGMGYMFLHILLVFALNNITNSLEFMQDEEVRLEPKLILLLSSFLLLFGCMVGLLYFAKPVVRCRRFLLLTAGISVVFVGCMILLRTQMRLNILVSVLYVYAEMLLLLLMARKVKREEGAERPEVQTEEEK